MNRLTRWFEALRYVWFDSSDCSTVNSCIQSPICSRLLILTPIECSLRLKSRFSFVQSKRFDDVFKSFLTSLMSSGQCLDIECRRFRHLRRVLTCHSTAPFRHWDDCCFGLKIGLLFVNPAVDCAKCDES